jgi:DNA-binding NarL/FixJ family response regulator
METRNQNIENLKIIVVDDSELYRKVIKEFLETELFCEIIGEAADGEAFLQMKNIHLADVVLMDLQMPKVSGFQSAQRASIQYPLIKMIAVTMYTDNIYLSQLIEIGFKGCIYKTTFFEDIIHALQQVMSGGYYFNESIPIVK